MTQQTLPLIASAVSIVVGISALISFYGTRRRAAIEEGKMLARHEATASHIADHERRIDALELRAGNMDTVIAEIRTDQRHILDAIREIKTALDRRRSA